MGRSADAKSYKTRPIPCEYDKEFVNFQLKPCYACYVGAVLSAFFAGIAFVTKVWQSSSDGANDDAMLERQNNEEPDGTSTVRPPQSEEEKHKPAFGTNGKDAKCNLVKEKNEEGTKSYTMKRCVWLWLHAKGVI